MWKEPKGNSQENFSEETNTLIELRPENEELLVAQTEKNLTAMKETQVCFLG